MKTYSIEISEVLKRVIKVNSDSIRNALIIANEKYNNEEVVLGENDFKTLSIDVIEEDSMEKNPDFANFVLKNAEDTIANFSIEELAKIGFGDYFEAIKQFDAKYYGN
jgi:DpnD/PcfM-like protein